MPRIDDQKSPLTTTPKSPTAPTGPVPPQPPAQSLPSALPQDATAIRSKDRAQEIGLSELVQKARAAAGGDPPKPDATATKAKAEPKPEPKSEQKGFFASLWHKVSNSVSSAVSSVGNFFSGLWKGVSGKASEVGNELYHKGGNLAMGVSFDDFKSRKVEDDPSDVNDYTAGDVAQAAQETQANLKAEESAIAKLSPDDQASYKAILGKVDGELMARRQIQAMLLSGALTGQKALVGGGNLLTQLKTIATQPLADGIDRKDLLSQVIGEVENPVRIAQHSMNTCGATTAQILLVRKDPAEYARLISGLASPKGQVDTAGGSTLKRKSDWTFEQDGGRSVPSRLFQPAVMQLGQMLPLWSYDNSEDKNVLVNKPIFAGMFGVQQAKIDTALTGQDYDNHVFMAWNRDSQWDKLKETLTKGGESIPVSMTWEGGGHFVQIDKVEAGKVHYTNPWGQRETMDEAEFKAHITEYQAIDN